MKCLVLGVNGAEDHVHVLARMHATTSVAELVKQLKGSSSHLIGHEIGLAFRWQGYYGAFTVSQNGVKRVLEYIARQKEHYAQGTESEKWEQCFIEDEEGWF